jgi:hypothetical protein
MNATAAVFIFCGLVIGTIVFLRFVLEIWAGSRRERKMPTLTERECAENAHPLGSVLGVYPENPPRSHGLEQLDGMGE